ncbi:class I SAM-dependent methyltransferase [Fusibacter sp. 3D3]|uniref:class I SAM-dependent methyltransferase n=1 Tax=Fusibacter sp. 3D3 TaxID=1048380 RepID=UPI000852DF45|nr:methyltransferase domain-containing protein [Fusibacter sp. 3D3]GAU78898.1 hypothetical protein F3D3_3534 [Fusibacter sp. 3D3]
MQKNTDFDKVAPYYDYFMNAFNLYKLSEIKALTDLGSDDVVLDVGGGTGQLAQYLSESCQTVYILDESASMLSKVKKSDYIICIQGDALKTPFSSDTFDCIILSAILKQKYCASLNS